MIYDVEMMGKSGHMAHVFVVADCNSQAENLAEGYFPELETTGFTVVAVVVPDGGKRLREVLAHRS